MSYAEQLNEVLKPCASGQGVVLDLFAGCGGLSLGFEAIGFKTVGFEMDADCCDTYIRNLGSECHKAFLTPEFEFPPASVVIGGPPCQPFSVGGKQLGLKDSRDGFPAFVAAIQALKPEIWMFENVRGVKYRNKDYIDEVLQTLRGLGYLIEDAILNAVDYGVPQNRERYIVVGHKGGYRFPAKGTTRVTAGLALGELASQVPPDSKFLTASMDAYVAKYERASKCINPRDLHMERPARTLTCRNLAGATGDMQRVRLADGRRRRLTVREAARLQSFPDWFSFSGAESSQYKQVGNAVPPMFAYHLAASFREYLEGTDRLAVDEIARVNSQGQLALF